MHVCTPVTPSHTLLLWDTYDDVPNATNDKVLTGWSVLITTRIANWRAKAVRRTIDAVLWFAGPLGAKNLDRLREVILLLHAVPPFVMTYARFNPRWMANPMEQTGSALHFHGVPDRHEVLSSAQARFDGLRRDKRQGA